MLKTKSASHFIAIAAGLLGQFVAGNSYADIVCPNGVTPICSQGGCTCPPPPQVTRDSIQTQVNTGNPDSVDWNSPDTKAAMDKMAKETAGRSGSPQKDKGKKIGTERCDASKALTVDCESTYDWIDKAQLTDMVGQSAGAATVGAAGQMGAIKAQSAGTQSAVMQATANTNQNAGMLKTTMGLANIGMGAYQVMLSNDHKQKGAELNTKLETANANAANGNSSGSAKDNPDVLEQGVGEQRMVQKAAMSAGVKSIITGVRDTVAGVLAIGAAKQAKDLANKLQDSTGSNYQITSANPTDLTNTTGSTTAISPGTATDPAVATNDQNIKAGDVPNITPPVNPDPNSGGPGSGPVAGAFQSGNPPAGGPGGASPNLGVGNTNPAKGDPEPGGPKMADSKANTAYGQGGSGYGPGGSGVSAEKSADLGFLANLLPKPQEEMGKNGILDYGNAGRSPASMAPYSFLGKDVNIFQRISDRTTAKLKSGDIGI